MSLFGSLFSGVSGLSAQSHAMSMISDNVANVNTPAYKAAIAQFSSLVTSSPSSSSYDPGGVRSLAHQKVGTQGLIQNSASPTDAAISGQGFFVVDSTAAGTGDRLYTRAGSFQPDFLGSLRTPSGFYLQGWALDADEQVVDLNTLETVNIRNVGGFATATTEIGMVANLDADQEAVAVAYAAGDMATWEASGGAAGVQPHFTRSARVYDSLGRPHNVTLAFLKDPAANTWNVEVAALPAEVDPAVHGANGLLASGQVTFNGDGSLGATTITPAVSGVAGTPVEIAWAAADGAQNSTVTFDFGEVGSNTGLTQFASETEAASVFQNGAEVGKLNGVSIDGDGFIVASFTNGEQRRIYRLPLATFANPPALDARTGNVFAQTDGSGEFNLRFAGQGGAGSINSSALEAANVDLADEFTKMIVTQRAYSANARVISASDEMLQELISIRR